MQHGNSSKPSPPNTFQQSNHLYFKHGVISHSKRCISKFVRHEFTVVCRVSCPLLVCVWKSARNRVRKKARCVRAQLSHYWLPANVCRRRRHHRIDIQAYPSVSHSRVSSPLTAATVIHWIYCRHCPLLLTYPLPNATQNHANTQRQCSSTGNGFFNTQKSHVIHKLSSPFEYCLFSFIFINVQWSVCVCVCVCAEYMREFWYGTEQQRNNGDSDRRCVDAWCILYA